MVLLLSRLHSSRSGLVKLQPWTMATRGFLRRLSEAQQLCSCKLDCGSVSPALTLPAGTGSDGTMVLLLSRLHSSRCSLVQLPVSYTHLTLPTKA